MSISSSLVPESATTTTATTTTTTRKRRRFARATRVSPTVQLLPATICTVWTLLIPSSNTMAASAFAFSTIGSSRSGIHSWHGPLRHPPYCSFRPVLQYAMDTSDMDSNELYTTDSDGDDSADDGTLQDDPYESFFDESLYEETFYPESTRETQNWEQSPFENDNQQQSIRYQRDEYDILSEREARSYVDRNGMHRDRERCILVGVEDKSAFLNFKRGNSTDNVPLFTLEESMAEMRELLRTAGMDLYGEITQRAQDVHRKMYMGTGKVQEVLELLQKVNATTVVIDAELSPGQQKSLESAINKDENMKDDFSSQGGEVKILDRTAVILDIFAQHAKTREGKLQVDLALHEYRKPRLSRMWTHLERQSGAGGVGLRGPGESQLEIDKRLIRDRIIFLKRKIDEVKRHRERHREGRRQTGLPVVSLLGYTNSGKSSLLNYITRAGVLVENMLFATLDPTTRKVTLPGEHSQSEFLLTDTVGFIQKLPTNLVAAFRATLEELEHADILVHVIDVSSPAWKKQENAVHSVLADVNIGEKVIVRVLNKIDLLAPEEAAAIQQEADTLPNTVAVSALHGYGMEKLFGALETVIADMLVSVEMVIPYSKGKELNAIRQLGQVDEMDYREAGVYVAARVPKSLANQLAMHRTDGTKAVKQQDDGIDWTAVGRGRHKSRDV